VALAARTGLVVCAWQTIIENKPVAVRMSNRFIAEVFSVNE
jgi:hypothetical protein